MNPLRVSLDGTKHTVDNSLIFSGGEVHVNMAGLPSICDDIHIKCWLQSSDDIMQLLMVSNILTNKYPDANLVLSIGYLPYARQDRACAEGDAFSLQVFAQVLDIIDPTRLYVRDIHSAAALNCLKQTLCLRTIHNIPQSEAIEMNDYLSDLIQNDKVIIVSPDAGAKTKAIELGLVTSRPVIFGGKLRDPASGALTGFHVDSCNIDLNERACFIVDDICDAGGTFLGLARELKKQKCGPIYLYVTHGIFSKGLEVFDGIISKVFCTDTVRSARDLKSTEQTEFHLIHV